MEPGLPSQDYKFIITFKITFFQKSNSGCNKVKTIMKFDFDGASYYVKTYIYEWNWIVS